MITAAAAEAARSRKRSVILIVLALLVFSPMAFVQAYVLTKAMADFPTHLLWAEQIKAGIAVPSYVLAHAGWQVLLLLFNLIGLPFRLADLAAILLCGLATAWVLLRWFGSSPQVRDLPAWQAALLTLGVCLAAPISAAWFLDGKFYLGYIGISSYHNPTILLLRPLALLQFILALRCFEARPVSKRTLAGMALVSMLAAFAKPNFAICLIPAMGLLLAYRLWQKQPVGVLAALFGFLVPSLIVLAGQFLISYYGNEAGGIQIAPFVVMGSYTDLLPIKFVLSLVFPLLVAIVYRVQAWQDIRMALAWLLFIFGAGYTYFLAESGRRFFDGNFTWSGEISLFVLFAASTLFFLEVSQSAQKWRRWLQGAWLCHVAVGILYYGYFLTAHIYV